MYPNRKVSKKNWSPETGQFLLLALLDNDYSETV